MSQGGLIKVLTVVAMSMALSMVMFSCGPMSANTSATLAETDTSTPGDRQEFVPAAELVKYPVACVDRQDNPTYALFHGCYDWHSSVHAHWSIFRADRAMVAGAQDKALELSGRYTAEAVQKVIEKLQGSPGFENPYGRSWLLLLISEYEAWASGRGVAVAENWRQLGDMAAASVLDKLKSETVIAGRGNYGNPAWALVRLHEYYQLAGNYTEMGKVKEIIKGHFSGITMKYDDATETAANLFYSPFWSWLYLLAETQDAVLVNEKVKIEALTEAALKPIDTGVNTNECHLLGMNWSKAWAIKSLANKIEFRNSADSLRLRLALRQHMRVASATHYQHRSGNSAYYKYAHWVPQFAIYALTD